MEIYSHVSAAQQREAVEVPTIGDPHAHRSSSVST
jgi:hypothetical protein